MANTINTRKMRYTSHAMAAFRANSAYVDANASTISPPSPSKRISNFGFFVPLKSLLSRWLTEAETTGSSKRRTDTLKKKNGNRVVSHVGPNRALGKQRGRNLGFYPFTSALSPWVKLCIDEYWPDDATLGLVKPFSTQLHSVVQKERASSSGLHDLDLIELTYQVTLEVAAAVMLAADATDEPVEHEKQIHSSRAGGDDQFVPWGQLLTGLDCQPPIISLFPYYLMMCQAFTFEPHPAREDYVYAALTGVDWAKGKNVYSEKFAMFEEHARRSVPTLEDKESGQDRSFWRIALAYLSALMDCENSRPFRTPRRAAILHKLDPDLVITMRALDTIGSAYMCDDGAAFLDDPGFDSLIGTALVNDMMDLHTDIKTGETRNFLRLLYPEQLNIDQAMKLVSTLLSGMLGELFRGHRRARFDNREDGRISATSPPYSFSRARHRRVFETLEKYITSYPQFWDWTWEIYKMAKEQVTEAGLVEPLVTAIKRAGKQEPLPPSPISSFFDEYYKLVEMTEPLDGKKPLGVTDDMAPVIRDLQHLWHGRFRENKEPGWGRQFDIESDKLFGDAGRILLEKPDQDSMYKFAIAYGRLSMALPYVAYHTIGAIILAFGVEK